MSVLTAILLGIGGVAAGLFSHLWKKKTLQVVEAETRAQEAEVKPLEQAAAQAAKKTQSSREEYEADKDALRDVGISFDKPGGGDKP